MQYKFCHGCKTDLPFECFHVSKRQKYGLADHCKTCRKSTAATRYKDNWFHAYCILKRSFCKKVNIPFDLTSDYLESIWTTHCPVFGKEFVRHDKKDHYSPTLDRLDPSKGYIEGNVCFISHRANRIKYDATVEELYTIAKWLEGATTIPKGSTLK